MKLGIVCIVFLGSIFETRAQCDWNCYLDRYAGLAKVCKGGKNMIGCARHHWESNGRKEGKDCTCPSNETAPAKPNPNNPKHILFLMIDDLGWNDVGYRGTSDLMSPEIDKLAMGGIRLNRYYTHNLCGPSRVSFLTGRYAYTIGMQATVIINGQPVAPPKEAWTVAEHLQKNGWATAAVGKWDAGMVTWGSTPNCRGFDYFYGFYGAVADHWTHEFGALDLHDNFEPDRTKNGTYSTHLYTHKAQAWISETVRRKGAKKTFLYLAYQAMHSPLQAPDSYIQRCRVARVTSVNKRDIYCGMMLAMDEGIKNITDSYKALGIWKETLVVLATDNGGHVGESGNNWPLRGEKSTTYEGGVRGTSFMYWAGLDQKLKGTESEGIIHVSDWLPTFVGGVAGLKIEKDSWPYALDGLNQWDMLSIPGTLSKRKSILHIINGWPVHQESYFDGQYKINMYHPTIYNWKRNVCDLLHCSEGWYPLLPKMPIPAPASENLVNGTNSFVTGGTWLFDVMGDPLEKKDLSTTKRDILVRLKGKLADWNALGIPQVACPNDPMSNPEKYFDNVWTPWRGSKTPSCHAGGKPALFDNCGFVIGNMDKLVLRSGGKSCGTTGWCADMWDKAHLKATPIQARVLVDGKEVATASALHSRAIGKHGFGTDFPCDHSGYHVVHTQCKSSESGEWVDLQNSPKCIKDGAESACTDTFHKELLYTSLPELEVTEAPTKVRSSSSADLSFSVSLSLVLFCCCLAALKGAFCYVLCKKGRKKDIAPATAAGQVTPADQAPLIVAPDDDTSTSGED